MNVLCDYLSLTVPVDSSPRLRSELLDLLTAHNVEPTRNPGVYRHPDGGTAKLKNFGPVLSVGFSGALLGALRACGGMRELLGVLSSVPHRVTRIDAALDVLKDAPPELDRVFSLGHAGRVRFGRQVVPASAVGRMVRASHYGGPLTGSVYLGNRGADRRLQVYDKRNERIDAGCDDPGPWTRYEMTFGKGGRSGITLRDAEDPTALFWSAIGGVILPTPPGIPEWVPAGEGFTLPKIPHAEPLERLSAALDNSEALQSIARLVVEALPAEPVHLEDAPAVRLLLNACLSHVRQCQGTRLAAS